MIELLIMQFSLVSCHFFPFRECYLIRNNAVEIHRQPGYGAHAASYLMGLRVLFLELKLLECLAHHLKTTKFSSNPTPKYVVFV
jgi:hypothetical protein